MEDLAIYQIVVPLVAIGFISSSIFHYRRGEVGASELILWLSFWIMLAIIAVIPDITTVFIANLLGFKSNVNALIFISLGVLFYLNFRMFFALNKLNRRLTDMVRKIALDKAEKEE